MAKFMVSTRKGPGDTFKKVDTIDAPTRPDGSHFETVLRRHLTSFPPKEYKQFVVQHAQSGDAKTFRVSVEPVIREL